MLKKYEKDQKTFCEQIKQILKNKKDFSHAILIDTNNYFDKKNMIIDLVKYYYQETSYNYLDIEHQMNMNIFADFKIIEAESIIIKKEQIQDLQLEFKTKSVNNNKRIYVIFNVENLNKVSANSLLKFLEEPEADIISILTTDNIQDILPTIKSRCQIFKLENNLVNNEIDIEDNIYEFILTLENKKIGVMTDIDTYLNNYFDNKINFLNLFDKMMVVYESIIKKHIKKEMLRTKEQEIFNNMSIDDLFLRIEKLNQLKKSVYVNANNRLLIDKFVLEIVGDDYE